MCNLRGRDPHRISSRLFLGPLGTASQSVSSLTSSDTHYSAGDSEKSCACAAVKRVPGELAGNLRSSSVSRLCIWGLIKRYTLPTMHLYMLPFTPPLIALLAPRPFPTSRLCFSSKSQTPIQFSSSRCRRLRQ